jgi:hypothetical protein
MPTATRFSLGPPRLFRAEGQVGALLSPDCQGLAHHLGAWYAERQAHPLIPSPGLTSVDSTPGYLPRFFGGPPGPRRGTPQSRPASPPGHASSYPAFRAAEALRQRGSLSDSAAPVCNGYARLDYAPRYAGTLKVSAARPQTLHRSPWS